MISVEAALENVLKNTIKLSTEQAPLESAVGRILKEPLAADRDFPPFNRVTMDGIALAYKDFAQGQRKFPIAGIGAAGAPQQELTQSGCCIEIMTGAILPKGTDLVIRYEDILVENQNATIQIEDIKQGQNVHKQGEDRLSGSLIVPAGRLISAAEIGVAATVGKSQLEVYRPISALILSSGDELVEVGQEPLAHQIRRSNVHQLRALLQTWGVTADTAHVPDDKAITEEVLADLLPKYDVLLLSGGVSKGKFDYIPDALEALGVQRLFHRVAQRPGKPFWFGRIPGGTVVFALPGNPVSSLSCTRFYVGAWLEACYGIRPERAYAQLARTVSFRPDLTYFLQVRLTTVASGQRLAEPVEGHGSGDLANLVDADAFLMLPQGKNTFEAGEAYPIWSFR